MDVPARANELHDALIEQYDEHDNSKQARDVYVDTLKQYTTAVVVASTQSVCDLLGVDMRNVETLELTERQYHRLEQSGMLDDYIDGKDRLDD